MPRATPFLEAFNGGEFSPRMDARVSFTKYPAASSRAKNLIALPQGGFTFRPGTRFVSAVQNSSVAAAVYGIAPAAGVAYILELNDGDIRFYRAQGRLDASNISSAVTNGTFGSNISGWTDLSTGSAAISHSSSGGGRMLLSAATDGIAWAQQSITVSGGDQSAEHTFRFELGGSLGAEATVQIGTSSGGAELFQEEHFGIGWHLVTVTPGTSPIYFQVINANPDLEIYLDNVRILDNEPLEFPHDYGATEIDDLRFSQVNDITYIFHRDNAVKKLERRADRSWSLTTVFFQDGPWLDINPSTDLEKTNLVKNSTFDGGYTDWTESTSSDGYLEYDGAQGVVFLRDAGGGGDAELRQEIATGGASLVHVIHFQIVGSGTADFSIGTTAGASNIAATETLKAGWYSRAFTPGVTTFHITFARTIAQTGAPAPVPGVGAVFCYNERASLLQPDDRTGATQISALGDFAPFKSSDVGRLIRLEYPGREPGWATIVGFDDTQHVDVLIHREFPSDAPIETWRMGAWSDRTGYPHVGAFHEQRLIAANTTEQPQNIWGSVSGDFENFRPDTWRDGAPTTEADNSFAFTLTASRRGTAQQVSPILWLVSARQLLVGTPSGQWTIRPRGAALSPSDFNAEQQTSVACADSEVVQIDNVALFISHARQSVYDVGYNYEIDGLEAADLTILADHIAGDSSFEQIVYQGEPYSLVWARRADGTLAVMTYKRNQDVVGWTDIDIGETGVGNPNVEMMAVIPGAAKTGSQVYDSNDRDELWLLVRRVVNGSTVRYLEVMEGFFRGPNRGIYQVKADFLTDMLTAQADAFCVDCGITYSGSSTTTITGLSHLEGVTVAVVGNGLVQTDKTVSSGQITGLTAVTKAQVGLVYDWVYRSLKLPFGSANGAGVGDQKTVNEATLVLLDAASFSYGLDHDDAGLTFYAQTDHMPASGALFTGEVQISFEGGHSSDPRLWLKGTGKLPFTMLGVAPKVTSGQL